MCVAHFEHTLCDQERGNPWRVCPVKVSLTNDLNPSPGAPTPNNFLSFMIFKYTFSHLPSLVQTLNLQFIWVYTTPLNFQGTWSTSSKSCPPQVFSVLQTVSLPSKPWRVLSQRSPTPHFGSVCNLVKEIIIAMVIGHHSKEKGIKSEDSGSCSCRGQGETGTEK